MQLTKTVSKPLPEPNWGDHQLHGGDFGLHQQNWQGELVVDSRGPAVELTTVHSDGTDGYPGNLSIKVKYVLAENEQLQIEMLAICDQRRAGFLNDPSLFPVV